MLQCTSLHIMHHHVHIISPPDLPQSTFKANKNASEWRLKQKIFKYSTMRCSLRKPPGSPLIDIFLTKIKNWVLFCFFYCKGSPKRCAPPCESDVHVIAFEAVYRQPKSVRVLFTGFNNQRGVFVTTKCTSFLCCARCRVAR